MDMNRAIELAKELICIDGGPTNVDLRLLRDNTANLKIFYDHRTSPEHKLYLHQLMEDTSLDCDYIIGSTGFLIT